MRYITLIAAVSLSLFMSCGTADLARLFKNVDLEKKGIHVKFARVPEGLYQKPFIIRFNRMLDSISNGEVRIQAFNIYTVGNYDKLSPESIPGVTNFLDPTCKFKDTWFGVYIIIDDEESRGRNFMLEDPAGEPGDLNNLKDRSLLLLPELDQKIILWSSHQGQKNYSWQRFSREFHFDVRKGTSLNNETITDRHGRAWYRITGSFNTLAALTDTAKSNMSLFSSIRSYVGLPTEQVYARVRPWHNLIIRGSVTARYFRCSGTAFWAVVYYNGGAYYDTTGALTDNWEKTDLRDVLEKMFENLELDCAKN